MSKLSESKTIKKNNLSKQLFILSILLTLMRTVAVWVILIPKLETSCFGSAVKIPLQHCLDELLVSSILSLFLIPFIDAPAFLLAVGIRQFRNYSLLKILMFTFLWSVVSVLVSILFVLSQLPISWKLQGLL